MSGDFFYSNPRVIHWGTGSLAQLGPELLRLKARRIALVTTRSLVAEENLIARVTAAMGGASVVMTPTIGQHAPLQEVDAAVAQAGESGADAVVSFGGGSAIDAAKMIAVRVADRGEATDRALPHVAIPTTLSAAELADGAGYTSEAGDKAGMRDSRMLADAVVYDAALTVATPMELWLSTGIRALDHAVEGFLAEGEHPFNDVLALEAIRRLLDSLPRAKAAPEDLDVRTENQLAAWFSYTLPGPAASGLSHVMGKQIGARHGIPHGVTSCLLMPHVMRFLEYSSPGRMARLERVLGDEPAGVVQRFIASLGLPQHIAAYGIAEPELRRAAGELAGKHSAEDLAGIYLAAL